MKGAYFFFIILRFRELEFEKCCVLIRICSSGPSCAEDRCYSLNMKVTYNGHIKLKLFNHQIRFIYDLKISIAR